MTSMALISSSVPSDYIEIYVDETGDRGFGPKSSRYFCFAACAFKHSNAGDVVEAMRELNRALGRGSTQPIHAKDHLKKHDQMMEAVEHLAELQDILKVFFVVLPKSSTPQSAKMRRDPNYVYNYLAKILLERMSWFARDAQLPAHPCFASVKRMPRIHLDQYISRLQSEGGDIDWQWLVTPVGVDQANNRIGMQWADIAGRAILKATTPGTHPPHRIEPVYLEALAPAIWGRRDIESYGIKSINSDWHKSQPWWSRVTALIPDTSI